MLILSLPYRKVNTNFFAVPTKFGLTAGVYNCYDKVKDFHRGVIMNEGSTVIQTTLIVDQLYLDIKKRIIQGHLQPEQKLSVRELCEYYRVSDTPIKQALNRLVTEQFVTALPRRGMRVRCITKQDVHESIQARKMVELFSIPYALSRAKSDPAFLIALEQNLQKNQQLLEEPENLQHYSDAAMEELTVSLDFHRIFVSSIENHIIQNAYQNIVNHQYVYYQHQKDKSRAILASLEEHKQIYLCLKADDGVALQDAILSHLSMREQEATSAID